ncbi:MAG: ArsR/SmtB family transcription factor [Candidatus Promineifilaceae bacterium]|jgi:ArsR family transcriptional regulator, virulence genes transcriptional regulator
MDVERFDLAESQSALCSVFANPKRVLILWALAEEERAVTAIAHAIDASLQNTSQHLSLMKAAGILEARRDGQTIYYRISDSVDSERCRLLLEARNGFIKN